MKSGLLWYDHGPDDLRSKVLRAAQRYYQRFGEKPDVCYVHPQVLPEGACVIDSIHVRPLARILKHHFWLGRETEA